MADDKAPDPAVLETLRLAIVAAGEMNDLASWRSKMSMLIPEIAATLSTGSREYRQAEAIHGAIVLPGVFLGYEFNDRSKRVKVTIQADKSRKGEPEHVWTERTDTKLGSAQATIVRNLTKGCRVNVWKGVENATHDDEYGNPVKVRMLYHIMRTDSEVRDSGPTAAGAPAPPSTEAPSRSGGAPPAELRGGPGGTADDPGSADSGSSRISAPSVAAALERLSAGQRVQVAKWAASQPTPILNIYGDLPDDQANSITSYIELLKQGMAT